MSEIKYNENVIKKLAIDDILPLLNKKLLFYSLWQFPKIESNEDELKYESVLANQVIFAKKENAIKPSISYGYYKSKRIGNGTLVDVGKNGVKFDFPRENKSPNFCLADMFENEITLALVTVGSKVTEVTTNMFKQGNFSRMFYLKGLAAALTEATMKYTHNLIMKDKNISKENSKRYSLGYPACPQLADQAKFLKILNGDELGIKLSSTYQLMPEYSVTAFISV